MAGEENKRQRRVQRLKRMIVIMLVMVFVLPISISILLAIQMKGLKNEIRELNNEVDSLQTALEEALAAIPEEQQELTDESATQDMDAWETRIVWDSSTDRTVTHNSGIRKVYLTFDDGPSANTDRILDILDEYGVKATFFVVGKEGYNDQYRRIVEDGHTLGMHSYSHIYRDIYQSLDAYRQDLQKLHGFLYELTGVDSRIVRFPGGSANTISKSNIQELIAYLAEENITYYDWNVSSGDAASGYVSAQKIADNVLNNVGRYNTAIVLMHDASDKDTTVEALPIIIEKILESENTVLLPISEDTIPIQQVKAE